MSSTEQSGERSASCETCSDASCDAKSTREGESAEDRADRQRLESRLCRIRHKILVLSGKGGVGKSTVAVNLAVSLSRDGKRVGILDVDIHGPSVPTMLRLVGEQVLSHDGALLPVELGDLKVMSLGFLLKDQRDAVIWRGPMKMGVIKQFIADVEWGELDYLVVDAPPGTGDEPLSVCQLIGKSAGAVIVTTPQEVALVSVRKSVTFCRQLEIPVLGVVENMSGLVCPHCGKRADVFGSGGGERMAKEMGVPFLGRIPMDPAVSAAGDAGEPYALTRASGPTADAVAAIVAPILALDGASDITPEKENPMRVAVPLAEGRLTAHFGHCASFAILDVDEKAKKILKKEEIPAPEHEPGLLPKWLGERGVTHIIAGGMGQRARDLFTERNIAVIVGAPSDAPEALVSAFLVGTLKTGDNVCDH